ncbi:MAG: hypothetical protein ACRD91_02770, partial [Nitrosopumilaceae archaeon]
MLLKIKLNTKSNPVNLLYRSVEFMIGNNFVRSSKLCLKVFPHLIKIGNVRNTIKQNVGKI